MLHLTGQYHCTEHKRDKKTPKHISLSNLCRVILVLLEGKTVLYLSFADTSHRISLSVCLSFVLSVCVSDPLHSVCLHLFPSFKTLKVLKIHFKFMELVDL